MGCRCAMLRRAAPRCAVLRRAAPRCAVLRPAAPCCAVRACSALSLHASTQHVFLLRPALAQHPPAASASPAPGPSCGMDAQRNGLHCCIRTGVAAARYCAGIAFTPAEGQSVGGEWRPV